MEPENKKMPKRSLTVGEKLKQARLLHGLTIYDVVKCINLRYSHVEAIENNMYDQLPERTYVLGYVASYARFLKLNEKELQEQVEKEYQLRDPLYNEVVQSSNLDKEYSSLNLIKDNILGFLVILISLGFKRYKGKNHNNYVAGGKSSGKSKLPATSLIVGVLILVVAGGIFLAHKKSNPASTLSSLPVNNETAENLNFNDEEKSSDPKLNSILKDDVIVIDKNKVKDLDQQNNNSDVTPDSMNQEAQDNPLPKNESTDKISITPFPVSSASSEITLNFTGAVWIRIYDLSNHSIIYKDKIFNKGDTFNVPNVPNLGMDVGNFKNLYLTVKGTILYLTNVNGSLIVKNIDLDPDILINKYNR